MTICIDPKDFANPHTCTPDSEWYKARILSEAATKEILGDNLSSVVAIGKDGKPVFYLPHGTDLNAADSHSHSDVSELLNFSIKIPTAQPMFATSSFTVCYPASGKPPRPCPC
jgi:hypothetical protein